MVIASAIVVGLAVAAVAVGAASAVYSGNRANKAAKDQKSAGEDARNSALALADEQKQAEADALAKAQKEAKDKRRAVTRTIFSEDSPQENLGANNEPLGTTTL